MKKHASALALAALLAAPAAHSAAAVDFSGDFEVNAYSLDLDDGNDDTRGFQQLLRLGANVKLEDGVQVVTRMNLQDNTWEGDRHADTTGLNNQFSPDASDVVTLDLGYVQLPLGPGVLRVGRQESNWGICFVSCDDRRDRIQWVGKVAGLTAGAGYDKRSEGGTTVGDTDGSGYYAFGIGKVGPALAGLLVYNLRWDENFPDGGTGLADEDLLLISPYMQAKLGGIDVSGTFAWQDDPRADDDQLGGFLRAGYDLGVAKIEGQVLWTDGYSPNQGWDSFSSMVNNNPENSNSPTTVTTIGRDALAFAARVSGNVTQQVKLVAAAGMVDEGDEVYSLVPGFAGRDRDVTFYDLQAHYQMTKSTLVWATAGRVSLEPNVGADQDQDAFSLNVLTKF